MLLVQVLRRADASRKEAKVVVDARRLRRYGRIQRGAADGERQFSVEEIHEEDSVDRGDLVQMDSIPEGSSVALYYLLQPHHPPH